MSSHDAEAARRTVVVVRHAKAEQEAATDHARPLTERGLADAKEAGRWLGERLGPRPDGSVDVGDATAAGGSTGTCGAQREDGRKARAGPGSVVSGPCWQR